MPPAADEPEAIEHRKDHVGSEGPDAALWRKMASVSPPSIIVVVSPAAAAPAGSGSGASGGASGGSSTGASTSSMPAPFKALQQTFSNG